MCGPFAVEVCPVCGAEFDERVIDRHFVYCPMCGSKLGGDEQ